MWLPEQVGVIPTLPSVYYRKPTDSVNGRSFTKKFFLSFFIGGCFFLTPLLSLCSVFLFSVVSFASQYSNLIATQQSYCNRKNLSSLEPIEFTRIHAVSKEF